MKKLFLAAVSATALVGLMTPAADAADIATVTLVRADDSKVVVPLKVASDGRKYAVDPEAASVPRRPGLPAGTVLTMAPASGKADDCFTGQVCLYTDANWSGIQLTLSAGEHVDFLGALNDTMSSWKNFSGSSWCWYFDANGGGEHHNMLSGISVNVAPREDNQASSVYQRSC